MCLLERIEAWDDDFIRCSTSSHRDPSNPLRKAGGLSEIHGLEYGAQAMAVHGALLAARDGLALHDSYVAAVRDLRLLAARLDTHSQRLLVEAHRLLGMHGNLVYNVLVEAGGSPLVTARVTVMPRPGEGS
jgi:predicted hotdog family 3-hydroxylacyl-ACP dehydratase